eukprot:TRINITY_DN3750_c0_g1_i2.p1 TRINITY_DN3750_c0_g1~~TRINITY_DN3750_c0_g1_i2.p1  ORF type:complete len:467 (-),score=109.11 TRINITY_DN3750_c0_g1_i2:11-1411(-)
MENKTVVEAPVEAPKVESVPPKVEPPTIDEVEVKPGLREVEEKIEVEEEGKKFTPPEELFSKKNWGELGLDQALQYQILKNLGFERPSKIQTIAIQSILSQPPKTFIGQAQSGSGKTGAFLISAIHKIRQTNDFTPGPKVICYVPTRELARQVFYVAEKLLKDETNITCGLIIPSDDKNDKILKTESHLLIGTLGKLHGLFDRKKINTSKLLMVIFDEADFFFSLQEEAFFKRVFDFLKNRPVQYCLFSATFNDESKKIINESIRGCKIKIEVPPNKLFIDKLQQFKLDCETENAKENILVDVLSNIALGKTIIFTQTREKAKRLKEILKGFDVGMLIGDRTVPFAERDRTMEEFKQQKTRILVTTNVLARGVDALDVSLVVNFDPPVTRQGSADVETYLHRVGRSARFGRPGIALNFYDNQTENILNVFEKHYSRDMKPLPLGKWDFLDAVMQDVLQSLNPVQNK